MHVDVSLFLRCLESLIFKLLKLKTDVRILLLAFKISLCTSMCVFIISLHLLKNIFDIEYDILKFAYLFVIKS
jgi:hypothetical protein